jgi:hypothetical protein
MSLPKLEIMKQKTIEELLVRLVEAEPGATTQKLFTICQGWSGGRLTAYDFDRHMEAFREKGYRVTNKQWYPADHVAPPKLKGPTEPHPKQTRWGF